MSKEFMKPLTPSLRNDINFSIEKHIEELYTHEDNMFLNFDIWRLEELKYLINSLPDGQLVPW